MLRSVRSKPTLKDVAQRAGCSTAVVSTVVNNARGTSLASKAMQERVLAAAKELGYRPNFASRSLARRLTQTIGIYVPPGEWTGVGMPYEGAILRGIEQACRKHDYDLLAINLGGSAKPDACARKFAEQRIDGLILLHIETDSPWVAPLLKQAPNIVAVNYYGDAPVEHINFDDRAAGAMAVRHLAELGHQRIAFVGSWFEPLGPGAQLRCEGYSAAMRDLGLTVDPRWIWDRGNSKFQPAEKRTSLDGDLHDAADHLWSLGAQRPTAVVAYNDQTAVYLMRHFQHMGVKLPEQLSMVGMDGASTGLMTLPELTSIRQPFGEMGQLAAESVITRAEQRGSAPDSARRPLLPAGLGLMAPELVIRQSTGPAPGG